VNDGKKIYTWDAENRLAGLSIIGRVPTTQADNVQITYDGLGRRISINELHGTTVLNANTFVWCSGKLCQQRDVTGHTITRQFFDLGEQINNTNYFYVLDHLRSVREMTDNNGVVHASYDYDMFGRQIKLSGDLDSDFGYTGFYLNKSTNLDMTWFRIYDPEKGRWLTRDPMEEFAGLNLYDYVNNKVTFLRDVNGLIASGSFSGPRTPPPSCGNPDQCKCAQQFAYDLLAAFVPILGGVQGVLSDKAEEGVERILKAALATCNLAKGIKFIPIVGWAFTAEGVGEALANYEKCMKKVKKPCK
jgi:RHS repeat-associated protein